MNSEGVGMMNCVFKLMGFAESARGLHEAASRE